MREANTLSNIEEKLNEKTKIDSITGCWLYGDKNEYIKVRFNYNDIFIHRIAAYLYLGLILSNSAQQANHKIECKNKNCCNPVCMYAGTQKENVADSMEMGLHHGALNRAKTHCPQNHLYDKINSQGKRICSICQKESNDKRKHSEKRKEYMKEYNKKHHKENYIPGFGRIKNS